MGRIVGKISDSKQKHLGVKRNRQMVIIVLFLMYISSYFALSRIFPAVTRLENDVPTYTFVKNDPDWEWTLFILYFPLIQAEEKLETRRHRFDMDYFF